MSKQLSQGQNAPLPTKTDGGQTQLDCLKEVGENGKPWGEWFDRVENLVSSAKEVAGLREEWPIYNMLDVVEEMICTEQGEKLGAFLKSITNN